MSDQAATGIVPYYEPRSLQEARELATTISKSGLVPKEYRDQPANVFVAVIAGAELGLSPMQSLRSMHVIEGKPIMSADLAVGLVTSKADVCEYFILLESDAQKAVYETKRRGHPQPTRLPFTIEEARIAGLHMKDNWKRYPAAMLRHRCSMALARAVYPDLLMGVYETDEAEDFSRSPQPRGGRRPGEAPPPKATPEEAQIIDVSAADSGGAAPIAAPAPATPSPSEQPAVPPPELPQGRVDAGGPHKLPTAGATPAPATSPPPAPAATGVAPSAESPPAHAPAAENPRHALIYEKCKEPEVTGKYLNEVLALINAQPFKERKPLINGPYKELSARWAAQGRRA